MGPGGHLKAFPKHCASLLDYGYVPSVCLRAYTPLSPSLTLLTLNQGLLKASAYPEGNLRSRFVVGFNLPGGKPSVKPPAYRQGRLQIFMRKAWKFSGRGLHILPAKASKNLCRGLQLTGRGGFRLLTVKASSNFCMMFEHTEKQGLQIFTARFRIWFVLTQRKYLISLTWKAFFRACGRASRDTLSNSFDGKRLKRPRWFHAQLAMFLRSLQASAAVFLR